MMEASGDPQNQPGDNNRGGVHAGPSSASVLPLRLHPGISLVLITVPRQGGYTCTHLCLPSALLGIFQFLVARRRLMKKLYCVEACKPPSFSVLRLLTANVVKVVEITVKASCECLFFTGKQRWQIPASWNQTIVWRVVSLAFINVICFC